MSLDNSKLCRLSVGYRLQWEQAQNMFVLLYPEGMVELNQSSAEILQLCDGNNSLDKIVKTLEEKFAATGLEADIINFLNSALDNGWITQSA
ncbi:MAG: pyrroloquinoline quinone biosynthesis peptide chaperone PqqD [Cycloclasticus sp.]|nr:pyrroloquinoline quinone biosynthesis protein PqqD [Cycloclasticus sp. 46_120_T64]